MHYTSQTNGLNISHSRPLRSTSDNAIITSIKCLNFLDSYTPWNLINVLIDVFLTATPTVSKCLVSLLHIFLEGKQI